MLERQGFEFKDHVDPFDGGPYIEAELDRIPMVAATVRGSCEIVDASTLSEAPLCIASCEGELGFRAVSTRVAVGQRGVSRISREAAEAIGAIEDDEIGWTPLSAKLDVPSTDEVVGS